MELRRLRHFLAVAEHGNFGRAAAASYITQPALSRSIQALEAEVGAVLFDRRTSGVELTDIGRLVLRHATTLDAAARDLDREISLAKGLELGELRVGVGPWGGAVLVAGAIGRLHARHPSLTIRVVVAPWRELPARLRDREVDVVVGSSSEIERLDELEILALSMHDTAVVGRCGHPLTVAGNATLGDVFRYPLAGPSMDSDAAGLLAGVADAVTGAPSPPRDGLLTIECDSSDVLKRVLMDSDALSIMPRFIVADELEQGRLAVVTGVEPGVRVRFGAAWLRGRTLGAVGTTFLEVLQAHDDAADADE
ncbi:MAG: LysR family transcriptional regulator [Ilumatobacteraceae bacterium]